MQPYRAAFPEADLTDLRRRLADTRWPDEIDGAGWSRGVPVGPLRALAQHWRTAFDWRAVEARLNAHPQFLTEVDGATVHLVHARSPRPDAVPLLVTHGWPGSVLEFLDIVGPLTDPPPDQPAFHVVLPTIPGFGLSGPPPDTGWDAARVGRAWAELMRRLGYDRYLVQGGDLGSWISLATAAVDPEHVAGVHLNFLVTPPSGPDDLVGRTPLELARLGRLQEFFTAGSAYMAVQATRPLTISYGLTDSPVGQLAWAWEKYIEWAGDPIGRDDVLANVTLTWLTATAASSAQFYAELTPQLLGPPGPPPPVAAPIGVAVYPADPAPPVRALAERAYPGIVTWTEHAAGGHFAPLEQPAAYVADLRAFTAAVAAAPVGVAA